MWKKCNLSFPNTQPAKKYVYLSTGSKLPGTQSCPRTKTCPRRAIFMRKEISKSHRFYLTQRDKTTIVRPWHCGDNLARRVNNHPDILQSTIIHLSLIHLDSYKVGDFFPCTIFPIYEQSTLFST